MAAPFSLTVKVDPAIERKLRELARLYPEALAVAMYEEMVEIMRESARRAPFEEGELRDSRYVASAEGGRPFVEGGYAAHYAVVQHERTDFHHEKGEAKFLQRAVDSRTGGMLERLGKRVDALAQKGGSAPAPKSEFPQRPAAPQAKSTGRRSKRSRVRAAAGQLKGRRRGRGG